MNSHARSRQAEAKVKPANGYWGVKQDPAEIYVVEGGYRRGNLHTVEQCYPDQPVFPSFSPDLLIAVKQEFRQEWAGYRVYFVDAYIPVPV